MELPNNLLNQMIFFANDLSIPQIEKVFTLLQGEQKRDWEYLKLVLRSNLPPNCHIIIGNLVDIWKRENPEITPQSLAMGLLSIANSSSQIRSQQSVELVWTGPDSQVIPLRRTDQVLIDLINQAGRSLWIVSFAIYRIEKIMAALKSAGKRGVKVNVVLETEEESGGRLSFDTLDSLRRILGNQPNFYTWPAERRLNLENGSLGVLHAKVAIADKKTVLISSANLTEYALSLNMEMGVFITGNEIPIKVERHFEALLAMGILAKI